MEMRASQVIKGALGGGGNKKKKKKKKGGKERKRTPSSPHKEWTCRIWTHGLVTAAAEQVRSPPRLQGCCMQVL